MFATVHAVAGAIIGLRARRAPAAFASGFASHLALDSIPHFGWSEPSDEKFLSVAYPDVALATATSGLLLSKAPRESRVRVAAGIAGSIAPDIGKGTALTFGWNPYPDRFEAFHRRIQEGRESPRGFGVEVVTTVVLALIYGLAVSKWAARGSNAGARVGRTSTATSVA